MNVSGEGAVGWGDLFDCDRRCYFPQIENLCIATREEEDRSIPLTGQKAITIIYFGQRLQEDATSHLPRPQFCIVLNGVERLSLVCFWNKPPVAHRGGSRLRVWC